MRVCFLIALPKNYLAYQTKRWCIPGHDYQGRQVSCVGQEKAINARLAGKTREAFIDIMHNLNLPKPRLIDIAVPANRRCGVPEPVQG